MPGVTSKGLILWPSLNDQFSHTELKQNFERIDQLLGTAAPLKSMIIFWIDAPNETAPTGWAYCDGRTLSAAEQDINPGGTYTLPNMLNMFPLGADPTKALTQAPAALGSGNIDAAAGAPGAKAVGGSNQITLASGNLPAHTHDVQLSTSLVSDHLHAGSTLSGLVNEAGAHTHAVIDPGHMHTYQRTESGGVERWRLEQSFTGGYDNIQDYIINPAKTGISIASAGGHTHTVTLTGNTGVAGGHSHSVAGATSSVGSGSALDNRSRYIGVVWIMKVKV